MDDDDAQDVVARAQRFACTQCDRSFLRREHLRRHSATHAPTGAFTCSICFKRFTRNDILMRHISTHATISSGRKHKNIRSCTACVAARTRCSSSLPCSRCTSRNIDCQPQPRKQLDTHIDASPSPRSPKSLPAIDSMSPAGNAFSTPPASTSRPSLEAVRSQSNYRQSLPRLGAIDGHSQDQCVLPELAEIQAYAYGEDNAHLDMADGLHEGINDTIMSSFAANPSTTRSVEDLFTAASVPQTRELYINSGGARLPKIRRSNSMRDERRRPRPPSSYRGLPGFPSSRPITPELEDESLRARSFLPQATWDEIHANFEHYCLTPSPLFPSFASSRFPKRGDFDLMIAAYFDSMHQIIPAMHLPSLSLQPTDWLLALGLASAGSHYLDGASKFQLVDAMHEFLHRALVHLVGHGKLPERIALTKSRVSKKTQFQT